MTTIISNLPNTDQITDVIPTSYSIDGFDGMDSSIAGLTAGIDDNTPPSVDDLSFDVSIPDDLNKDSVTSKLTEPLTGMTSINAASITNKITGSPLGIDVGTPDFDINTPMKTISDAIAPGATMLTPNLEEQIPGLDSDNALYQLQKLAAAGKGAPMRMVNIFLKIFDSFVTTVSDKDKIVQLASEALADIYLDQIEKLGANLPYAILEDMKDFVNSDFLEKYEQMLDDLEQSLTIDLDLVEKAREEILPRLKDAMEAGQTLLNFSNSSLEELQKAIDHVLEFTGDGEAVLQQFFDKFEAAIVKVLDTITPPVELIAASAEKINAFLTETADKAEDAATEVATKIDGALSGIDTFLKDDLAGKIDEIKTQIADFLKEISGQTDAALSTVKGGLGQVTGGLEDFFEQVNELKEKLETAVNNAATQVDDKTKEAFELVRAKIEEVLDMITGILDKPEVKDALDKTKEGIEKFKKVMEEFSLQPVFDVVVTKTGDIEVKIQAINVAELGVPQKTALKLGAKVLKEVKVDEIIKPELIALFKELRDPIAELIKVLEQGVLSIGEVIDKFAPGTLVRELIENAEPYKEFMALLDKYKPSFLLQPLKDANDKLTALVEKLDPDILIDKLQGLYDKIYPLVAMLDPDTFYPVVTNAVQTVTSELKDIKDYKIDEIIAEVKKTISLKRLLEGTGIEDIADAEIWNLLERYLGGVFLTEISDALQFVEDKIEEEVGSLQFTAHKSLIKKVNKSVEEQIGWTKRRMVNALNAVSTGLSPQLNKIQELENRRKQLLTQKDDVPEYKDLLNKVSLKPLTTLQTNVTTLLDNEDAIEADLTALANLLDSFKQALSQLDPQSLSTAAKAVFKNQFSDPINAIITAMQAKLQVFTDAVEAIKSIITLLLGLPERVDASVANILDTAVDGIKTLIETTINLINDASRKIETQLKNIYKLIVDTLDKYSPYGLLNSFAEADFEENGMSLLKDRINAKDGEIAIFISEKLEGDQAEILSNGTGPWQAILLEVINKAVLDPALNGMKNTAMAELDSKIVELNDLGSEGKNMLIKCASIKRQLEDPKPPSMKNEKFRLNRVILEAMYPGLISMSLQSMHPFIVEQIARLYPTELVESLDSTYLNIVNRVKSMPKEFIQEPLDGTYTVLKDKFKETFDITGIFRVLEVKLDGMDEDLELGLNRVSFAFNHLLDTIDTRM